MDSFFDGIAEFFLGIGTLLSATIFTPSAIPEKDVGDAFSAEEFNQFIGSTKLFYLDNQDTDLDTTDDMLGIGKNPTTKLDVAGSVLASGNMTATYFIGDGSLLTGIAPEIWVQTGSDINYPTGEVGIGVADPTGNLDIVTASDATMYLRTSSTDGNKASLYVRGAQDTSAAQDTANLYLQNEANADKNLARISAGNADSTTGTPSGKLYFATNTGIGLSTAMTIDDDQQVGIGVTSPSYDLDVAGDVNFTGDLYQGGTLFKSGKFVDGLDTNNAVYLTGDVGIGTNDPQAALDVNGNIAWGSGLLTTDEGGSLELGDAGGNPFIDFKNDPTSDYDVRLSLIGNDSLEVSGGTLVAPEPITGTEVANKNYVDDRTVFAQVTNIAIANVNGSGGVVMVFNTTPVHNADTSVFTPLNTGVQILEAGVYEVTTNLYGTSSDDDVAFELGFTINGTLQSRRAVTPLITSLTSHNATSGQLSEILTLTTNDIVGVTTTQAAETGTVALPVGESNLIIKRLE